MSEKQRPFIKLWRQSLWSDPALQACSKSAQWLWIRLFTTVMEDATPYGHLLINGKPPTDMQLGRIAGESVETVQQWMQELHDNGVFSQTVGAVIFSRKMVSLEQLEEKRRRAGRQGGNPILLNQVDKHGAVQSTARSKRIGPSAPVVDVEGRRRRSGTQIENQAGYQTGGPILLNQEDKQQVNHPDNHVVKPRVQSTEYIRVPPKPPKGGLLVSAEDLKRFEAFWAVYPNKVAKPDAIKCWAKIRPDQPLTDRIIAAVGQHCRSPKWLKDGGEFIPHPATWLNRQSWNDQLSPLARAPTMAADTKALLEEYRQTEAQIDAQRKAKREPV